MDLGFDEAPDYEHLRFLLQKSLLDENIVPSKTFDWLSKSSVEGKEKTKNDKSNPTKDLPNAMRRLDPKEAKSFKFSLESFKSKRQQLQNQPKISMIRQNDQESLRQNEQSLISDESISSELLQNEFMDEFGTGE